MSAKPLEEQFRRNTAVSLTAIFFVLLWLPTLDLFFHMDKAPTPNENRAMAVFPAFSASLESIRNFPGGLEAYFRDHFGFRNRLIRCERRWKHDLFQEQASSDVIAGRAGWYFFSGDYSMDDFQGLKPFTQETLQRWKALLEKRRDWLAKRGIKYLFVVPPDKHTIYPEFLPSWLSNRGATTRLDQFMDYMTAHSTVEVLDLRPALREEKKNGFVYLQTDTHWNGLGGFITYQRLVRALTNQIPELGGPLPLSDFKVEPTKQAPGDLAKLLGLTASIIESNGITTIPIPPLKAPILKSVPERFPKKWRPRTEPAVTEYDAPLPKAILFRDSFAGSWTWLLGYHFHEVLYIWQYNWDAAFLEREKPTVVIDEMLERFMNNDEFLKQMEADDLP